MIPRSQRCYMTTSHYALQNKLLSQNTLQTILIDTSQIYVTPNALPKPMNPEYGSEDRIKFIHIIYNLAPIWAFLRMGSILVAFMTSPRTLSLPLMNSFCAFALPATSFAKSASERRSFTIQDRRISFSPADDNAETKRGRAREQRSSSSMRCGAIAVIPMAYPACPPRTHRSSPPLPALLLPPSLPPSVSSLRSCARDQLGSYSTHHWPCRPPAPRPSPRSPSP